MDDFILTLLHYSDAASGLAGWALAHPEFGSSVNPIPTREADYAHHITACPPGFENITASLQYGNAGCEEFIEGVKIIERCWHTIDRFFFLLFEM